MTSLLTSDVTHTACLPLVLLVGICSGGGAAAEGSVGSVIAGSQAAAFMLRGGIVKTGNMRRFGV